mmetsp:Transcript_19721/g.57267  ORF Transcript_19721/g.57267 Transcript_19721/m.57267 type:complete len:278 (-) Transcript_19721:65-898(-)
MQVWRPVIPISDDGDALTVSLADFFNSFPYNRLPSNDFMSLLLRPHVPFALCALYLASKPILTSATKAMKLNPKSLAFVKMVALHNLGLAIFSAIVFVNAWPIVLGHFFQRGWEATYCDQDGSLWDSGLGGWTVIFYVSKYYEFADTWVLILKGKKPSFLQTYHHIGIVLTMWAGVASKSAWLLIVVLLNSGIHTLMYTYFFVKTLDPQRQIKGARYLTTAQIAQFFTGVAYTLGVHILGNRCDSPASRLAALIIQLYAVGLIFLFISFAAIKYKNK